MFKGKITQLGVFPYDISKTYHTVSSGDLRRQHEESLKKMINYCVRSNPGENVSMQRTAVLPGPPILMEVTDLDTLWGLLQVMAHMLQAAHAMEDVRPPTAKFVRAAPQISILSNLVGYNPLVVLKASIHLSRFFLDTHTSSVMEIESNLHQMFAFRMSVPPNAVQMETFQDGASDWYTISVAFWISRPLLDRLVLELPVGLLHRDLNCKELFEAFIAYSQMTRSDCEGTEM